MTVESREKAFEEANKIVRYDYIHNSEMSKRAGYDIYFTTHPGTNEWISDLGNRLEVNRYDGKTFNIWIDDRHELEKAGFKKTKWGFWVAA